MRFTVRVIATGPSLDVADGCIIYSGPFQTFFQKPVIWAVLGPAVSKY